MVNGEECILIDIQLEEGFLLKPILQNLNNGRKLEYEHPTATRSDMNPRIWNKNLNKLDFLILEFGTKT